MLSLKIVHFHPKSNNSQDKCKTVWSDVNGASSSGAALVQAIGEIIDIPKQYVRHSPVQTVERH